MTTLVRNKGVCILRLDGRFVGDDAVDEFRTQFLQALADGAREFVVDMSGVPMIDSSAMGALVRCHSNVHALGGALVIVGANQTVRTALKLTRLDRLFDFFADEAGALAALHAPR